MTVIAVQLKYQAPSAAAPTDMLYAVPEETLMQAVDILAGKKPDEAPAKAPLPEKAASFSAILDDLVQGMQALAAELAENGHDHCDTRRDKKVPSIQLQHLREFHSSPKQIANLLGCEAGYFDNPDPEEIICVFSPVRFVPAVNFFDIRQG